MDRTHQAFSSIISKINLKESSWKNFSFIGIWLLHSNRILMISSCNKTRSFIYLLNHIYNFQTKDLKWNPRRVYKSNHNLLALQIAPCWEYSRQRNYLFRFSYRASGFLQLLKSTGGYYFLYF